MSRIVALFAIIALIVMSTGMASAQPMPMPGGDMPMAAMVNDHGRAMPKAPCSGHVGATCDLCCAVAAAPAPMLASVAETPPSFLPALPAAQSGLIVPPALPPPRA